jgi:hypothetical protein
MIQRIAVKYINNEAEFKLSVRNVPRYEIYINNDI